MSVNTEEEAKARLEVAQLYVEMGQLPKAVRYFMAAAEIYRDAGQADRASELLQKILEIEPGNVQAQKELSALGAPVPTSAAPPPAPPSAQPFGLAAPTRPSPPPAPPSAGLAAAPPPSAPSPLAPGAGAVPTGKIAVPTPWIFPTREQQAAILSQITEPPDPTLLPYDRLPRVDSKAIQEKIEERQRQEDALRAKDRTRVESAFGDGSSSFEVGGGLLNAATLSGRGRRSAEDSGEHERGRRRRHGLGGARGGNQDLADAIRRRLQNRD